jgi:hypothetical protein
MKLLSVAKARSIWLGHTADFNPKGINILPVVLPLLVDQYKFVHFPSLKDAIEAKDGIQFKNGEFVVSEQDHPIAINLTIYNDGLVADSESSTVYSDAFLLEILTKLSDIVKGPSYEQIIRKKNYLSELFVSTNESLEIINPKLKQISKQLRDDFGEDRFFEVGRISFWPDQLDRVNPIPFSIERAVGVPFSENRYFSSAPLHTAQHIKLLDRFEKLFSKK